MQRISVFLFKIGVWFFGLIPFWVLYRLSDLLYFIFLYVIKYRYEVVKNNLEKSFPEKNETEIKKLIKKFYTNLCDILLEGIKGLTMSEQTLLKRYKFIDTPEFRKMMTEPRSIIFSGGHYTNWEWLIITPRFGLRQPVVGVYKAIKNPYMNEFMFQGRTRFGIVAAPMEETRQVIQNFAHQQASFILIGDQSPSNLRTAHRVRFLNQETAWLPGVGSIAQKMDFPVYYNDVYRVRRGFYEVKVALICDNPTELKDSEITKLYVTKLEEIIQKNPANWLWSHKRWKHNLE